MGYCLTRKPVRSLFRRTACVVLALFTLTLAVPPHGALAFGEFSIKDEVEMGRKIRMSMRLSLPLVDDPEVQRYVDDLLRRLSKGVPPQPFPLSVNVVRHNAINAFAVPGGNLFLFTGLILSMDTESELAGVLAHEMAHATQRHMASRIKQANTISLLSLAGAIAGAFIGGNAGSGVMAASMAAGQAKMLENSRSDEADADQVGMNYLVAGGFSPRGMAGSFEKIRRQQWLLGLDIPTYLSTHPAIDERIVSLSSRVDRMSAATKSRTDDNRAFFRIQALIRSRYADPDMALATFARQKNGEEKCLAFMGEGIIYARQNKIAQARNAFDQALDCGKADPLILREAGIFHYMKGTHSLGEDLLRRAVSLNPKDALTLFYYGRVLADSGDLKGAQRHFREVLMYVPDDPEVHYYYAQALGRDKQLFLAYLHMAYSSFYSGDGLKAESNIKKARDAAKTPEQQDALQRYDDRVKERRELLGS
ncbi:M48 family metalloprotease [Desulfovibrio sp. OttesenSCG-928-I05]|nr:M48 family metalloprotease [Desulfovibrio sp. OttesenSCG-928-I05]